MTWKKQEAIKRMMHESGMTESEIKKFLKQIRITAKQRKEIQGFVDASIKALNKSVTK